MLALAFHLPHPAPGGVQLPVLFAELLRQIPGLGVQAVQLVVGLLQNEGRGGVVLLRLLRGGGEAVQAVQPHGHLHRTEGVL